MRLFYCDHNHKATEVRLLPCGGGGYVQCCERHYKKEMHYRFSRFMQEEVPYEFPLWRDLKVVE